VFILCWGRWFNKNWALFSLSFLDFMSPMTILILITWEISASPQTV
jgi:hypothetical protein